MFNNNLNSFYGIVKTLDKCNDYTDLNILTKKHNELTEEYTWVVDTDPSSEGAYCMVGNVDRGMIFFPDYVTLSRYWFERTDISLDRKLSSPPTSWLVSEAQELLKVLDWLLLAVLIRKISAVQAENLLIEFLSVGRVPAAKNRLATNIWFRSVPFKGDWLGLYKQFVEGEELLNTEDTIIDAGIDEFAQFNPPARLIKEISSDLAYGSVAKKPEVGGPAVYIHNDGLRRPEVVFLLPEDQGSLHLRLQNHYKTHELLNKLKHEGLVLEKPKPKLIRSVIDGDFVEYLSTELPIWAATRRV